MTQRYKQYLTQGDFLGRNKKCRVVGIQYTTNQRVSEDVLYCRLPRPRIRAARTVSILRLTGTQTLLRKAFFRFSAFARLPNGGRKLPEEKQNPNPSPTWKIWFGFVGFGEEVNLKSEPADKSAWGERERGWESPFAFERSGSSRAGGAAPKKRESCSDSLFFGDPYGTPRLRAGRGAALTCRRQVIHFRALRVPK